MLNGGKTTEKEWSKDDPKLVRQPVNFEFEKFYDITQGMASVELKLKMLINRVYAMTLLINLKNNFEI